MANRDRFAGARAVEEASSRSMAGDLEPLTVRRHHLGGELNKVAGAKITTRHHHRKPIRRGHSAVS